MFRFTIILVLIIPILAESKHGWSYKNTKQWTRTNRYCGGKSQSPIDLQFSQSQYDRRLKQIVLEDKQSEEPSELFNNGHTAQLNVKNRYVIKHVAPESEEYKVEQIHFHWGHANDNTNGSEHTHEGQAYPLELHMVSYSNWYPNIGDAMTNTRGLAVIGAFFELSEEPNPLLQPLVDALGHVRREGQRVAVDQTFDIKALIGEERLRRYYRYDGSLTTPPCYESVIWTVLLEPLKLSLTQLHAFRYLHDDHAKVIENTYRKLQPLGTRKLFRSFHAKDLHEDIKQRTAFAENHGENLKKNIKLLVVLATSLLVFVL